VKILETVKKFRKPTNRRWHRSLLRRNTKLVRIGPPHRGLVSPSALESPLWESSAKAIGTIL
jgi:hypothetical protein